MMRRDPVATAYLERLRAAGARLPLEEFEDLWASVTEHLDAAAERGEPTETALTRLGTPEELAASAAGEGRAVVGAGAELDGPGLLAPSAPEPRLRTLDTAALVLREVGAMVFGIGWFVGIVLLWSSDRWTTREKVLGTLVLPGGLTGFIGFGAAFAVQLAGGTSVRQGGEPVATGMQWDTLLSWLVIGLILAADVWVTFRLMAKARPGRSSGRA